jgi:hypothetical protein
LQRISLLASLAAASTRLNLLDLSFNNLPPSTLASLTNFLNGTGDCLEVLDLHCNADLFGTTNLAQHGLVFVAIANHSSLWRLDIRHCGLNNMQTNGPLQSDVFKNNSLVWVQMKPAEGIRSDMLMELIQSTMISPINVKLALWPKALGVCTPRLHQVGARPISCLAQKMAEVDVFDFARKKSSGMIIYWWRQCHYRMKARACARIQRCWRHYRLVSETTILFPRMKGRVNVTRKRKRG